MEVKENKCERNKNTKSLKISETSNGSLPSQGPAVERWSEDQEKAVPFFMRKFPSYKSAEEEEDDKAFPFKKRKRFYISNWPLSHWVVEAEEEEQKKELEENKQEYDENKNHIIEVEEEDKALPPKKVYTYKCEVEEEEEKKQVEENKEECDGKENQMIEEDQKVNTNTLTSPTTSFAIATSQASDHLLVPTSKGEQKPMTDIAKLSMESAARNMIPAIGIDATEVSVVELTGRKVEENPMTDRVQKILTAIADISGIEATEIRYICVERDERDGDEKNPMKEIEKILVANVVTDTITSITINAIEESDTLVSAGRGDEQKAMVDIEKKPIANEITNTTDTEEGVAADAPKTGGGDDQKAIIVGESEINQVLSAIATEEGDEVVVTGGVDEPKLLINIEWKMLTKPRSKIRRKAKMITTPLNGKKFREAIILTGHDDLYSKVKKRRRAMTRAEEEDGVRGCSSSKPKNNVGEEGDMVAVEEAVIERNSMRKKKKKLGIQKTRSLKTLLEQTVPITLQMALMAKYLT